jgi:hypothetical protein
VKEEIEFTSTTSPGAILPWPSERAMWTKRGKCHPNTTNDKTIRIPITRATHELMVDLRAPVNGSAVL